MGRLDACGADAELIGLAKDCLAPEGDRRPRHAGEVARRISAYQAGVQERLQAAERARVEAQARAVEERKRRRLTAALAAAVLVIAGLAGGGWAYLARQRQERAARFHRALGETEALYTQARQAGDDPGQWLNARHAAHALEELLADASDAPTRKRVTVLIRDVTRAAAAAANDQKLLARLVDIRSARDDDRDGSATDMAYEDAFHEAGLDLVALPAAEAAAAIQARPDAERIALAAALDDWANMRRKSGG